MRVITVIPLFLLAAFAVSGCNPLTPIERAVSSRNIGEVKNLIEQGQRLEERGYFGMTPLQHAAFIGEVEMVKYLTERGGNVNATGMGYRLGDSQYDRKTRAHTFEIIEDPLARSVLAAALLRKWVVWPRITEDAARDSIVVWLLQHGADPDRRFISDNAWPLFVSGDKVTNVGRNTIQGLEDKPRKEREDTPLTYVCDNVFEVDAFVLRTLLDHGADRTVKNSDGLTPIEVARKRGLSLYVKILEK